jgi:hypothetical protein
MRDLLDLELSYVSGAGACCSPCPPSPCKTKNNNGYGNGAESGPPPGNSGDHNPQLTGWNSGPKGAR